MNPQKQALLFRLRNVGWLVLAAAAVVAIIAFVRVRKATRPLIPTVADLQPVHAGVVVSGHPARETRRVPDGSVVETDADGRARVQLDDGTSLVVAGSTKLTISSAGIQLDKGRLFAKGGPSAHTEINVGGAVAILTGANAAISRGEQNAAEGRIYAAAGELTLRANGRDVVVHSGEAAALTGSEVKVAPERVFNDWTGGLAAPWAASGRPNRVVGELWGRNSRAEVGEAGSPLTIRSQEVQADIVGETAMTTVKSSFFHAGAEPVTGDFRMAIPPGAIVASFATGTSNLLREATLGVASRDTSSSGSPGPMLEWAGEGWVRGYIPTINPGSLVQVVVRYIEWLHPQPAPNGSDLVLQYRLPLVAAATPPVIGEFLARIDTTRTSPRAISAGQGATVTSGVVELRKSDFRPSADLVVELQIPAFLTPARSYVAPADDGDEAGDFLLVRAEAPQAKAGDGVAIALVLDASSSIDPGLLDAERAFVEAVVGALGPRDQVVAFAASDALRAIGPDKMGPADEARRKAIVEGLAKVHLAGATDLGRTLEGAADALNPAVAGGMVVYVGDGWPTMGDLRVDEIRARLARRASGMPRVGAVAAGPVANRFGLTALVRGSGPILEIADRADAAASATALIAEALQPAIAGAEIVLGPDVEQVYPLGARAITAGHTLFAVGRTRGDVPRAVTLRWRDETGARDQKLELTREKIVNADDVKRRWAAARVEEIALQGRGREAAADVALRMGLLTPWTAWCSSLDKGTYRPSPLESRVLDIAASSDAVFSSVLATPSSFGSSLLDVTDEEVEPSEPEDKGLLELSVSLAARRVVNEAIGSIRSCRDSRAALRPDLSGTVNIRFDLEGDGKPVNVKISGSSTVQDEAMYRCIAQVVEGLPFPVTGLQAKVAVSHDVDLLAGKSAQRVKCSETSSLPLALRRGVWLERLRATAPAAVFNGAKRTCELPTWTDQRAMLELILTRVVNGSERVGVANALELSGESEAAAFLRREAVRRARTPEELRAVRATLLAFEKYPRVAYEKEYAAANDDAGRMKVVRKYLSLAPHDIRLRLRLLALLEESKDKAVLLQEVSAIRSDPFADARLLAQCAAALRRAGEDAEGRRLYGEIVERAPSDPWARAFTGDRLRNEKLFEDAIKVYAPLEQQAEGEQAIVLRMALAYEGAGRVDLATRMLTRLSQMGGRSESQELGNLAVDLAAATLAEPRTAEPAQVKELQRRLLELPLRKAGTSVLLRLPASLAPLEIAAIRGPKDAREERGPDIAARAVGVYRVVLDAGDDDFVLRMAAKKELLPSPATPVKVIAIVSKGAGLAPVIKTFDASLPADGKPLKLQWTDGWKPVEG